MHQPLLFKQITFCVRGLFLLTSMPASRLTSAQLRSRTFDGMLVDKFTYHLPLHVANLDFSLSDPPNGIRPKFRALWRVWRQSSRKSRVRVPKCLEQCLVFDGVVAIRILTATLDQAVLGKRSAFLVDSLLITVFVAVDGVGEFRFASARALFDQDQQDFRCCGFRHFPFSVVVESQRGPDLVPGPLRS